MTRNPIHRFSHRIITCFECLSRNFLSKPMASKFLEYFVGVHLRNSRNSENCLLLNDETLNALTQLCSVILTFFKIIYDNANTTNDELSLNKRMSHDNIKDRCTNDTEIDEDAIETATHVHVVEFGVFHDQSKHTDTSHHPKDRQIPWR